MVMGDVASNTLKKLHVMSEVIVTMVMCLPGQASGLREKKCKQRQKVVTHGFSSLQHAVTYLKRRYGDAVTSGYATSKSSLYHLPHCSTRSHEKFIRALSHCPFS
jgi:hypothetical protein